MKKIFFILLLINLYNCSNPSDCFDSTGEIIQKEILLDSFDKINVGNEVSLILKQGDTQKVIIETGENLISDVMANVTEGKLFLEDKNTCNLTRDYAITKVYVTSPNIKEIRSNTARDIKSDGVLNYTTITLISEDFLEDSLNIGDFNLNVNANNVAIVSNGNSIFNVTGNTISLHVGFYSGSSRFIGNNLIADRIYILQKSTNDILIHPINSLEGNIYSIGDVISYNHPNHVEIEEHYTGKLIFQ